uniref:Uncharacterized protein n=1 Tax=Alexandrium catenella TaxID=2925 RepID=A0A7S1L562_ALECA|mmetsp:Transcript_106757/g.284025  ORF Transcript_106757/g.284025 Transcript_106757/m.284025 type:complete len:527 (+) Transcript_106757:63-1643(+)
MLDLHDREKGAAAPCMANSADDHSGCPPANGGSGFSVGEKVRYWSQKHHKWVDAHVQRVNRGPMGSVLSYDLTAKAQAEAFKVRAGSTPANAPPPPQPLSVEGEADLAPPLLGPDRPDKPPEHLEVGERVKYWSASVGRWVAAVVLSADIGDGRCDLDLKPGAPLARVRKAAPPVPGAAQGGEAPAWPSTGPRGPRSAPPPPLSCGFKVGDQVQYWSETKTRWLEAVVEAIREKDGGVVYDLDCKKGTPADRVRPSLVASLNRYRVGEEVEYWSTSAGRWLPAQVLTLYTHLCQCDLDIKPGAPLGRLRPVAGSSAAAAAAPEPRPPAGDAPLSPTSSAEPERRKEVPVALDGRGGQKAGSDPLQLNQLLKESAVDGPERKPQPVIGEWRNGTKTMRISESGDRLLVDMGPLTPTLALVELTPEDQAWPKEWSAVRKSSSGRSTDPSRALYILELANPKSDRLMVKRPVGEGQVEFMRAGGEELAKANPQSGGDGPSATSPNPNPQSGSPSEQSPPGRTRSRSPRR